VPSVAPTLNRATGARQLALARARWL